MCLDGCVLYTPPPTTHQQPKEHDKAAVAHTSKLKRLVEPRPAPIALDELLSYSVRGVVVPHLSAESSNN